jgi:hypothetical protein
VSLAMLCFVPLYIFPHDLTLMGGASNFTGDKTTETLPPEINDEIIDVIWNAELSGDFSTNISYRLDLGFDTIWRYYLAGEAVFRYNPVKLGLGTFFHCSKPEYELATDFLNPGMIVNVGFEFPGALFADFKTILTFYEKLEKKGNLGYDYLGFSIGYWTSYLIAGVYSDFKEFKEKRTDTLLVRDSLTRYFLHIGIYDKNRIFTVYLDFGYAVLEFEMSESKEESTQEKALFAGVEFIIQMSNSVSWHIKGEMPHPLYYPSDFFWWTAQTGLTIKLAD